MEKLYAVLFVSLVMSTVMYLVFTVLYFLDKLKAYDTVRQHITQLCLFLVFASVLVMLFDK